MQEIIDISPPIRESSAVWPGDQPFRRIVQCQLSKGHSVDLSSMTTTVHIGSHADAPCHYRDGDVGIDEVALDAYIGPCRVIEVLGSPLIEPKHCQQAITDGVKRCLFKTNSQPDPEHFNTDFTAISPEAMRALGRAGVQLVGIDTASVDPFSSKDLLAHHELLQWQMRNLEGLDLRHVDAGDYELIALPLRLVGFDASPVRAILRRLR